MQATSGQTKNRNGNRKNHFQTQTARLMTNKGKKRSSLFLGTSFYKNLLACILDYDLTAITLDEKKAHDVNYLNNEILTECLHSNR